MTDPIDTEILAALIDKLQAGAMAPIDAVDDMSTKTHEGVQLTDNSRSAMSDPVGISVTIGSPERSSST